MTIQDYKDASIKLNEFHRLALNQYVYEITYQGDPNKWYHGGKEPLQHDWINFTSLSICLHCGRTVKHRRK